MFEGIYNLSDQFCKMAGRVPVDLYHDAIEQVYSLIVNYSKNIQEDEKLIGFIPFSIKKGDQEIKQNLFIFIKNDKKALWQAGITVVNARYFLIINKARIDLQSTELISILRHEITHFIDYVYNKIPFKITPFLTEFSEKFRPYLQKKWPEDLKERDQEFLAQKAAFKYFKTAEFDQLLKKYDQELDFELRGKLLSLARDVALIINNDLLQNSMNRALLGGPQHWKGKAFKSYINSDEERKAFLNHIISELNEYGILKKQIIKYKKAPYPLSELVKKILDQSGIWKEIKDSLNIKSEKYILSEIGKYIQNLI